MNKKIKINIPGFGERYCSNNVEYKLFSNGHYYIFYKKGTNIIHNEYGPAIENKNESYSYIINNKYHRLNNYAICSYYNSRSKIKNYYVIGKFLGYTKEKFIEELVNTLIPNDKKL